MSKLYLYYQKIGGSEAWTPVQAETNLSTIKPTFVTILALDTLLDDEPTREALDAVKYLGPMYFDLDAEDIADSIEGGKELLTKLLASGLQESDIEIYLSGKKGLHFIVSPVCFMEKVQPLAKLPAVYKEMAFKLAVDTVDFKVYTARKGRMLRTCYNIRENENYRVPVTAAELRDLTAESYSEFCKAPRHISFGPAGLRPEFALIYDAASQKVASTKRRKLKPVTVAELQRAQPEIQQILKGEGLADIGFNKIAMQLCVYARESKWSEDDLVRHAKTLCEVHQSDSYRYNTPAKREGELRRMFSYVEDNPAYEYSIDFLRSCIQRKSVPLQQGEDREYVEDFTLSGGVSIRGNSYMVAKGDDGEIEISNFVFRNTEMMLDPTDSRILAIRATIGGELRVVLSPNNFTSSSALQNTVSSFGRSFTGSDVHARGVYQLMLKEVSKTSYIVDSEGMNYITLPAHPDPEVSSVPFLAWADRFRVVVPAWLREKDVKLEFLGFPEERGVLQTDLTQAPPLRDWMAEEGNIDKLDLCFRSLFESNTAEVLAKSLGWMVAAHYKPLFHATQGKFPLLHVFGPAGLGKTEMLTAMLKFFYYMAEPKMTSPSSTAFALITLISGSASIPVLLDEWKPASMNKEAMEKYHGIFRDVYNAKETQRGGGSRTKDVFNALNRTTLSGPLIFVSEAADTETALMERCVLLSYKRAGGQMSQSSTLGAFRKFQANTEPLSILGKFFAGRILQEGAADVFLAEFNKLLDWANGHYLGAPDDIERFEKGELSKTDLDRKHKNKPRPVYNCTVTLFGVLQLRETLKELLGDRYDDWYVEKFRGMSKGCYMGLDQGTAMLPEYIKVLAVMSDMSRTAVSGNTEKALVEGTDYNLAEIGGKAVLVLASRFAYNKYRQYCKLIGQTAMYPNEVSFEMAMLEIPQYIKTGMGTQNLLTTTAILDLDLVVRAGVPIFSGRVSNINL